MYILQKKDKPRTSVQSIGPQTKFFTRLQGATSSPALANRNYIGCCFKPSLGSAMHWRHSKMYVFKLFVALHWFLHNLFHSLVMSPMLEIADLQVQPSQSPPPFPPSIILNDATVPTEVVIYLSTTSNTSITKKRLTKTVWTIQNEHYQRTYAHIWTSNEK